MCLKLACIYINDASINIPTTFSDTILNNKKKVLDVINLNIERRVFKFF